MPRNALSRNGLSGLGEISTFFLCAVLVGLLFVQVSPPCVELDL